MRIKLLCLCCQLGALGVVNADEVISNESEQTALNVTIYNHGEALVKDTRKVTLAKGKQTLAYKDVSAQIKPETVIMNGNSVSLIEQNFEYDLLSPEALLNKYVGKEITVLTTNSISGEQTKEQATVLATNNGVLLKFADRIQQKNNWMEVIYNDIPANLRDKPTLTMLVDSASAKAQTLSLNYLTGGMNWSANYVANLKADDTLDITGWVSLENTSGTDYNNAKLQLVAGEVNKVQPEAAYEMVMDAAPVDKRMAGAPMQQESLFEYHLYTLPFNTTINNNQNKQVLMLEGKNVPFTKVYSVNDYDGYHYYQNQYTDSRDIGVNVAIELTNSEASQLGMPLPAGVVRTYQNDSSGNAQFIGEDRIEHTPKDEKVNLTLGEAFDIKVSKKQTDFDRRSNNSYEASYEIELRNHKDVPIVVDIYEQFYGDWRITEQNVKSEKTNAQTAKWQLTADKSGTNKLIYTVRVDY